MERQGNATKMKKEEELAHKEDKRNTIGGVFFPSSTPLLGVLYFLFYYKSLVPSFPLPTTFQRPSNDLATKSANTPYYQVKILVKLSKFCAHTYKKNTGTRRKKCGYVYQQKSIRIAILFHWRFPQMPTHIHMTIGLEADTLFLKQGALAAPARGCAAFLVDHTMTGQ